MSLRRVALLALCPGVLASCAPAGLNPDSADSLTDDVERARTLWVAPGVGGEWDDATLVAGPLTFSTIQDAIDAATTGDTVSVSSGIFEESVSMKDDVRVVGAGRGQTYLVGIVDFVGNTGAELSSMSLYDPTWYATGTSYTNHGIVVNGGDAIIEDIDAYYFNYAIWAYYGSSVTVDGAQLARNWYGVVSDGTADLALTNSLVYGNPAGGVSSSNGGGGSIVHNTFVANGFGGSSAYLTGAVALGSGGSEVVANNIMTSNYYGLNCYSCSSTMASNLVWGNTTDYVNDASSASTDVSQDPQFEDAAGGDYALSMTSPAIDAGALVYGISTDAHGESRPQGAGYDLGMDEYATTSYDLQITEVVANASTESTGEFVEIYNAGSTSVDLAGLVLTDGDDVDTLQAYGSSGTTVAAGEYAVVIDPDYASDYTIDSAVILLTTGDTTLGNGLTTSDELTLYESDGSTIIATFSYPSDPGDGVSMEMVNLENGDSAGNWRASQCTGGVSPGDAHCFPESGDPADLVITEVMANAKDESTGEYVEIYNPTTSEIDLAGLVIADSASSDTLEAYASGSTLLPGGAHALVLDSGYAYDYYLPTDIVLVTAGKTIGNGISNASDSIYLYAADGSTLIDSYTSPSNPGDGISREKVRYAAGDVSTNWEDGDATCPRGATPGRLNAAAGGICEPLLITEVQANADDEDTGEFIEIYNAGGSAVDLNGLVFSDGDADDTLTAYDGGSTVIASGGYAVIVDAEFAGDFSIDSAAIVVTTTDTTLGNSLSVSDGVQLYEADGDTLIDSFQFPSNPGNAISIERVANSGVLDSADNWEASTCVAGNSAGGLNCVSSASSAASESSYDIVITEVMANAYTESTGEFIELYNNSSTDIDLLYWVIYDGDAVDTLLGWSDPFDTVLAAGSYAIILDADYAGDYSSIPATALVLTTDDTTIGSGLATNDPIYFYEDNAVSLVDSFTSPSNPGNGISIERIDLTAGDSASNWQDSPCSSGSSPGEGVCP